MSLGERVDRAAVADRSPVLRGVLAAGTLSGSRVAMGGTSAAAPRGVRALWEGEEPGILGGDPDPRLGSSVLPEPPELRARSQNRS